jgi:hypothetical protein
MREEGVEGIVIMKNGRDDDCQLPVPEKIRRLVPARYGVEIVPHSNALLASVGDRLLIISDQRINKHVDLRFDDDFLAMSESNFVERIVAPIVARLQQAGKVAA